MVPSVRVVPNVCLPLMIKHKHKQRQSCLVCVNGFSSDNSHSHRPLSERPACYVPFNTLILLHVLVTQTQDITSRRQHSLPPSMLTSVSMLRQHRTQARRSMPLRWLLRPSDLAQV